MFRECWSVMLVEAPIRYHILSYFLMSNYKVLNNRIRGIGGNNSHPGPVEAMNRVRVLLLGKDPELIIKEIETINSAN